MTHIDTNDNFDDRSAATFGERFRRERKRRGERQIDAAERFGVSQATMFRWETGENRPDPDQWSDIAEYMLMPLAELIPILLSVDTPVDPDSVEETVDPLTRPEARAGARRRAKRWWQDGLEIRIRIGPPATSTPAD